MNKQKRLGRPTTKAKAGQKATLGIRATADLKNRLMAEANRNDRSLSQEAEIRLEQSFRAQSLLPEVLELRFGAELAGLLLAIGSVMEDTGPFAAFSQNSTLESATHWFDNPHGYDQAIRGAATILEAARPDGEISLPKVKDKRIRDALSIIGQGTANSLIAGLHGHGATVKIQKQAESIGKLLGDIARRMQAPSGQVQIIAEERDSK